MAGQSRSPLYVTKAVNAIRPLFALALIGAIGGGTSGCGTSTADVSRGRMLFVQKCGSCHALAQAGTSGQVGPNLDRAFAAAREVGQDSDTFEGIVKNQVEFPRPAGNTGEAVVAMPKDIVTGQDLNDVAAYVATNAGVPGAAPPKVPGGPGAQVFADSGCGGCHVLAAARSGGVTGPDLDRSLSGQTAKMVNESIVKPNAKIAKGYPPGVMPENFEATLSSQELDDLVRYLVESTSKSKGGAPRK